MERSLGARVLVVDDEPAILKAVAANLRRHGMDVQDAASGEDALDLYERMRPDLVILDLGLPGIDGLEVIRRIRERAPTPIIVLSARDAEREKISALDLGADDYVTKPFGADELLARIRVSLRHLARPARGVEPVFEAGDLRVDLERREVTVAGEAVRLTPTEYELLKAFIEHPNKVLTDRMLLQRVWGPDYGTEDHYLHVYVARLRRRLGRGGAGQRLLVTEPGVGYRLVAEDR
jgi:two-component system KDP operon response regulator KdpE